MQPLKFRAYDKKTKEYRSVSHIHFSITGEISWVVTLDSVTGHDPWSQDIDEIILEQYTGLKDKNGKEIYGGDIVKGAAEGLGVVAFEDGMFWLRTPPEGGVALHYYTHRCEVIGNIHENLELLEKEKE